MNAKKVFQLASLALLLASCSANEEMPEQDNLLGTPITITAGVGDMQTRAGFSNDNLPAHFYINIDQEGTEYDYYNVRMVKQSDNSYAPQNTALIWGPTKNNVAIQAYYLGPSCDFNNHIYSDYSIEETDLLGATSAVNGDITISGSTIAIRFRHILSKLDVTCAWGEEFTDVTEKSINSIWGDGLGSPICPTIDYITSSVKASDCYGRPLNKTSNPLLWEGIFVPEYANPYLIISTTINGESREFHANIPVPAEGFKQGYRYSLNVSIGGNSAEIGDVVINKGWEDAGTNGDLVIQ